MVTVSTSRRSSRSPTSSSRERLGLLAGLVERLVVEGVGDAEGADDDEGVDPRLAARAEDLGDDPLAFEVGRGIADHLEGDLVAGLGSLGPGVADGDGVVKVVPSTLT